MRKQEEGGFLTLPSLQILDTLKTLGDPPPATHIRLLFLWGPHPFLFPGLLLASIFHPFLAHGEMI